MIPPITSKKWVVWFDLYIMMVLGQSPFIHQYIMGIGHVVGAGFSQYPQRSVEERGPVYSHIRGYVPWVFNRARFFFIRTSVEEQIAFAYMGHLVDVVNSPHPFQGRKQGEGTVVVLEPDLLNRRTANPRRDHGVH